MLALAYLEMSGMVGMSTGRGYCTSVLVLIEVWTLLIALVILFKLEEIKVISPPSTSLRGISIVI